MPILNIELSEYDALRDRVRQLESENKNLLEAIEEKAEDGRLRIIKKTVTIMRNPWKAFYEHALDSCTEKYEFLNFDDIEQEAKSQFYKDMANRIQSQERQEISELKERLKRSQEQLDSLLGRIDRLMKRNWWDRLWNKEVKQLCPYTGLNTDILATLVAAASPMTATSCRCYRRDSSPTSGLMSKASLTGRAQRNYKKH